MCQMHVGSLSRSLCIGIKLSRCISIPLFDDSNFCYKAPASRVCRYNVSSVAPCKSVQSSFSFGKRWWVSLGVARMRVAVAVRALESCRCLSQFTSSGTAVGSWRRYAYDGLVPVPYSTSVGSNVTEEHVERLEKSQSPLWMSSPMIQSALTGTPFNGSKCVMGGLEGAILMEPATWGIRGSHRARPQDFVRGYATSSPSSSSPSSSSPSPSAPSSSSPSSSAPSSSSPSSSSTSPSSTSTLNNSGRHVDEPNSRKAAVFKQTLLDFGAVPFPALVLGIAGLIPFVALAPPLASFLPLPEILHVSPADAQAAYGACIVTFLGAVHWGLAMAQYAAPGKGHGVAGVTLTTTRYLWSVVPSLVAWTALLLHPAPKFALLMFSLGMVLGVDFLFAKLRLVPFWFLSLRWPLTVVATLSMIPSFLVAVASYQL